MYQHLHLILHPINIRAAFGHRPPPNASHIVVSFLTLQPPTTLPPRDLVWPVSSPPDTSKRPPPPALSCTGRLPAPAAVQLRPPDDRTAMSWTSWTALVPTVLLVCTLLAWWFTEPKTTHLNLILAVGCLLFFWTVAPDLAVGLSSRAYAFCFHTTVRIQLSAFLLRNARMLLTGAAVVWYVGPRSSRPARTRRAHLLFHGSCVGI